jgi:K+-transporting ATPase A subunit
MVGMLVNVLLAVFIGGLMVGRHSGAARKGCGPCRDEKLVVLATLAVPLLVLVVTAASVAV